MWHSTIRQKVLSNDSTKTKKSEKETKEGEWKNLCWMLPRDNNCLLSRFYMAKEQHNNKKTISYEFTLKIPPSLPLMHRQE